MKKAVIAILTFLYISTSTGATIHLHYCMGKLVNWNLRHKPGKVCSKCGMKINHKTKNNGCCKDEYKQIKNENDQKLSQTNFALIHPVSLKCSTILSELLSVFLPAINEAGPVSNSPPRSCVAINIRNCVFLI